jgi:hypothetical protein
MIGEHVKWKGSNPDTWSGPGIGKVVDFQTKRAFFGPDKRQVGPAVLVKLYHNEMTVWCGIDEVELHKPPAPTEAA